jgi:hypothetical protein
MPPVVGWSRTKHASHDGRHLVPLALHHLSRRGAQAARPPPTSISGAALLRSRGMVSHCWGLNCLLLSPPLTVCGPKPWFVPPATLRSFTVVPVW